MLQQPTLIHMHAVAQACVGEVAPVYWLSGVGVLQSSALVQAKSGSLRARAAAKAFEVELVALLGVPADELSLTPLTSRDAVVTAPRVYTKPNLFLQRCGDTTATMQ